MYSHNPRSMNNNYHAPQCIICYAEIDNLPSKDSRKLYKLCTKYLHSGMTKEILDDCELEGNFSNKDDIPLCGKCLRSATELEEAAQTLASLRKRVSDKVIIFSLEILHRRGKNARNEETLMKLIQVDVSELPENDSWRKEIVSTEIQEHNTRVRFTDKEDNVDPVAHDLDFKVANGVEIEVKTEAEQLPGSIGDLLRNTPCATLESISPQENTACVTEIGNTVEDFEYEKNECIIRTKTGGKDSKASTETLASEIAVENVVIGENIDLTTHMIDRKPKTVDERNNKNKQNRISMSSVKWQKIKFPWKINEHAENVIIVNDGVGSAKPNLLPQSKHILKNESQVSKSQTSEVLNIVQDLQVPSMLPNQIASASTTVCSSSTAKQGKNALLKKTSVQKSSAIKCKSKHSGDSGVKCSFCDKEYSSKAALNAHFRTHTGEKPFKCSVCYKEFSCKASVERHLRTHTGEKPFNCTFCDKDFAYSDNLNTHLRIHTGEKPFQCTSCKMSFSQNAKLIAHMRIHTGEKPFKCDKCDYSGIQASNLIVHKIRRHSNKRSLKCRDCQKTFKTRYDVRKHYKCVHKNIIFNDECILPNN